MISDDLISDDLTSVWSAALSPQANFSVLKAHSAGPAIRHSAGPAIRHYVLARAPDSTLCI